MKRLQSLLSIRYKENNSKFVSYPASHNLLAHTYPYERIEGGD